jgi:hypothetical protein
LRAQLKAVSEELADRKRVAMLLTTENQRLKKAQRDLELRLADMAAGRPGALGERSAMAALRTAVRKPQKLVACI